MGDVDNSKARAAELSFKKASAQGISQDEEEELKRLREKNAMERRAAGYSSPSEKA